MWKGVDDVAQWLFTKWKFQRALCKSLGGRGEMWGCREQYRVNVRDRTGEVFRLLEGLPSGYLVTSGLGGRLSCRVTCPFLHPTDEGSCGRYSSGHGAGVHWMLQG